MSKKDITPIDEIKRKIYSFRGLQVMIDQDLALLYNVETKVMNQTVKRNNERFPDEFMFQLTHEEYNILKSQTVTSSWGGRRTCPYVFTEQGVAMLSAVIRSETAVQISIQIMNAFIAMRSFLLENGQIFSRLERIERRQVDFEIKTETRINDVFNAIQEQEIRPQKGIFFEGQVYDAYNFLSDIIKSAKKSILIIDNYIDDTVITQLIKKKKNIKVILYTKKISKQLALDAEKFNAQYPSLEIKELAKSHDRFVVIDDTKVYHIGASLKDLGKKWFAFSRLDRESVRLLERLNQ